jgi:adenylate cyclase
VDIAVMFADVRGSTSLAESMDATAYAALLNRFYKAARDVLVGHHAIIDKMIGDEVMAFFIPAASGAEYHRVAVQAANELSRAMGSGSAEGAWIPVGIGIQAGSAYVGKIGGDGVHDFTALGDTVNTAARFQAQAAAGEIVISEALYQEVATEYPSAEQRTVELAGKQEPVAIRVVQVNA